MVVSLRFTAILFWLHWRDRICFFKKINQARLLSFLSPLLSTRLAHMSTEDSMPDGNHLDKSDCTAAHQVTAGAVFSILRQGICSASLHCDVAPA